MNILDQITLDEKTNIEQIENITGLRQDNNILMNTEYQQTLLCAKNQSPRDLEDNLAQQIERLASNPSKVDVCIITCYLSLNRPELLSCFIRNGGYAAIKSSLPFLNDYNCVYELVITIVRCYPMHLEIDVILSELFDTFNSQNYRIIDFCMVNGYGKMLFHDPCIIDKLIVYILENDITQEVTELLLKFTSLENKERVFFKYFMIKNKMFDRIDKKTVPQHLKINLELFKNEIEDFKFFRDYSKMSNPDAIYQGLKQLNIEKIVIDIVVDVIFGRNQNVFIANEDLIPVKEPMLCAKCSTRMSIGNNGVLHSINKLPADVYKQQNKNTQVSNMLMIDRNLECQKNKIEMIKSTDDVIVGSFDKSLMNKSAAIKVLNHKNSSKDSSNDSKGDNDKIGVEGAVVIKKLGPPPRRAAPVKKPPQKPKIDISKFSGKTYLGVRWTKLIPGKTIWQDISILEVDKLFETSDFLQFEKKIDPAKKSVQKEFIVPILDPKKNNAINIALGRVKIKDIELLNSVLELRLGNETLARQLLENLPSDDELINLKGREFGFGRAEIFYKLVEDIEEFKRSLNIIIFVIVFENQDVSTRISVLYDFFRLMIKSQALKEFLRIMLFVGNVVNIGVPSGNASGFLLTDISCFADSKGGSKQSLLDLGTQKFKQREELLKDLNNLSRVSDINVEGLESEMNELKILNSKVIGCDDNVVVACCNEYRQLDEQYKKFISVKNDFEEYIGCKVGDELFQAFATIQRSLQRIENSE